MDLVREAKPSKQHRFHFLDALRGVAAILVVPRHVPAGFSRTLTATNSMLAVDFFFCLSGFVVAFSYEKRLLRDFRFKDFFITRAIRLYPLAAVGTLIGAVHLAWDHDALRHFGPWGLVASAMVLLGLLIVPLPHAQLFPLDSPMWTLFMELIANYGYGGLVRSKRCQNWVLGTLMAAAFAILVVETLRFGTLDVGFGMATVPGGLARVCFSFCAGVLLYRLFERRRLLRAQAHAAQGIGGAAVLGAVLVFFLCTPLHWMQTTACQLTLIALALPAIVYAGAFIEIPARFLPLSVFLGTISYPIYILHQPILALLLRYRAASSETEDAWIVLACIVLVLAIAWIVAEFYDRRIRQFLTAWIRTKEQPRQPTAVKQQ